MSFHLVLLQSLGRLEWHLSNYTKAREVFEEGVLQLSACVDRQASAQLLHAWAQLELGSKNIKQARYVCKSCWLMGLRHVVQLKMGLSRQPAASYIAVLALVW